MAVTEAGLGELCSLDGVEADGVAETAHTNNSKTPDQTNPNHQQDQPTMTRSSPGSLAVNTSEPSSMSANRWCCGPDPAWDRAFLSFSRLGQGRHQFVFAAGEEAGRA